jgi:hypothetical protein
MLFNKKKIDTFLETEIRYIYKAKYRNNIYIIKERVLKDNILFDLSVYKNNELIHTVDGIVSFHEAEKQAYEFGKSLLPKKSTRYDTPETREKKKHAFSNKFSSIEIKVNTLCKKYPDEKGILELKQYIEEILYK